MTLRVIAIKSHFNFDAGLRRVWVGGNKIRKFVWSVTDVHTIACLSHFRTKNIADHRRKVGKLNYLAQRLYAIRGKRLIDAIE